MCMQQIVTKSRGCDERITMGKCIRHSVDSCYTKAYQTNRSVCSMHVYTIHYLQYVHRHSKRCKVVEACDARLLNRFDENPPITHEKQIAHIRAAQCCQVIAGCLTTGTLNLHFKIEYFKN